MLDALKRIIKKCPNLLVLLAGVWICAATIAFVIVVEDRPLWTWHYPRLYAVLYHIHNLPHAETVAVTIFFVGCGVALAALLKMVKPWIRPR